jgi:cell division protein FtsN
MLPKQEVEVPEGPSSAKPAGASLPKGDITLQAGSFKQVAEAEKLQAQLAQYGVDAKIQRFSLEDETWYRVRIGPIATVNELNTIRAKLAEAEVEATPVTAQAAVPPP